MSVSPSHLERLRDDIRRKEALKCSDGQYYLLPISAVTQQGDVYKIGDRARAVPAYLWGKTIKIDNLVYRPKSFVP